MQQVIGTVHLTSNQNCECCGVGVTGVRKGILSLASLSPVKKLTFV